MATKKKKVPKVRNHLAREVRDPNGMFRPKAERDKSKYCRKAKHKKADYSVKEYPPFLLVQVNRFSTQFNSI
jgi:hypothetical protein